MIKFLTILLASSLMMVQCNEPRHAQSKPKESQQIPGGSFPGASTENQSSGKRIFGILRLLGSVWLSQTYGILFIRFGNPPSMPVPRPIPLQPVPSGIELPPPEVPEIALPEPPEPDSFDPPPTTFRPSRRQMGLYLGQDGIAGQFIHELSIQVRGIDRQGITGAATLRRFSDRPLELNKIEWLCLIAPLKKGDVLKWKHLGSCR